MNRYIVELYYGCWLAPWNGGLGRTLVIGHAQQFCCEMSASKSLEKAKKRNMHRDISDARVVLLSIPKNGGKMEIDLSLKNEELYAGCDIEEVAGRLNLKTPVADAVNIVGKNIGKMVESIEPEVRGSVTLTGPMAVWVYLIVFHAVVHAFSEVLYCDGRSKPVIIARHG